ncbi:MAG: nucleotidyltransferase family protein [archaeon]
MPKLKIAISIDRELLRQADAHVDGSVIRSRSQAIELFLEKGLSLKRIDTAVIFLKGDHQELALENVGGRSLILRQLEFFGRHGIKQAFIVTQYSRNINRLLTEVSKSDLNVRIVEKQAKGNADALLAVEPKLPDSFVAISGDTYNDFNLSDMIQKHIQTGKLVTLGLMSAGEPSKYGIAVLDGDLIVDFEEKPKVARSNVVNAGIYVFSREALALLDRQTVSLEKDLFPKLARIRQLLGYFTHGEYRHLGASCQP